MRSEALEGLGRRRGRVRFHVRPATHNTATHEIARLEVDCTAKGNVVRYPLHLRVGLEPTADMPSPPVEKPLALRHGVRMRRALSSDEAMLLSDEEALAQGLPLRPNPESVPQAFDAWLRCLSMPACRIEPHLVSNPDVTHGKRKDASASSSNWCGYALLRSEKPAPIFRASTPLTEPYDWVSGTWQVPFVTGEPNTATYSALWVGLDGSGTADLVQAGTEHQATHINSGGIELTLSSYHAWAEFLPQQPNEQVISNFAIHPGDEIFTAVWIGNGDNSPSLSSASATFFMMNLSTGGFTSLSVPRSPLCVKGREAVWAMERPTVGGSLPDLANYGSAVIYNASARRANNPRSQGFVPYGGARGGLCATGSGTRWLGDRAKLPDGPRRCSGIGKHQD